MARTLLIRPRLPIITVIIACSTLFVYLWSNVAELCVYDRDAIYRGELWRIITAPLVHFSLSHFIYNVLVFSAAGWLIERSGARGLWFVYAFAALSPGLMFLWTSPELIRYGGLSGLATGGVTYLSLYKARQAGKDKFLWLAILMFVVIKIIFEIVTSKPLFVHGDLPFRVLPATHVLGCIGAIATWMWTRQGEDIPSEADNLAGGSFC